MTEDEYLWIQLASECNEVAHRVTKVLHFGADEIQPGQELTNTERVAYELADMLGVMEMLNDRLLLPDEALKKVSPAAEAKKLKVAKYMDYARKVGTLT